MRAFPDEIFSLIFQELPDNGRDSVDTACRRFHAIMEPIRYRSVELQASTKIQLFLRSIIHNPRLTQLVRKVDIMWYINDIKDHPVPEHWRNGLLVVNQYLNQKIAGNIPSAEVLRTKLCDNWGDYPEVDYKTISKQEEKWLMNGIEVIILGLFFKILTNLVDLELLAPEAFFSALDSCPGKPLVVSGALTEGVLPNLQRVTHTEGPKCLCPSAQFLEIMLWLRHPGVRNLIFTPSRWNPYPSPPLPSSWLVNYKHGSNVEDLVLSGPMKWTLIESVLMLPKRLTQIQLLSLKPCPSFLLFSSEPRGWFHRSLSQSLLRHAHSLRKLVLQFKGWPETPETAKEVTEFTFDTMLLELTNLRELVAPINLFLGLDPTKKLILSDTLPSSLYILMIWPQDKTSHGLDSVWNDEVCISALNIGLEKIISQCPLINTVFLRCFEDENFVYELQSLVSDPKVKGLLAL
jgi:hypothetical protein